MARLRWVAITLAPPLVYVMVLYLATRPPKPVYTFARHTVMTVTDKGGPAILHAPPAIYPPQALRAKVEGSVILNVTIAADGTVARAVPISGPEPLRRAGRANAGGGAGRADIGPGALTAGGHRQRAAVAVRGQGARDADRRRVFATLRDALPRVAGAGRSEERRVGKEGRSR